MELSFGSLWYSMLWITLLLGTISSQEIELEPFEEEWRQWVHDNAEDFHNFVPEEYRTHHSIFYKGDDALLAFLMSKGCSYLAGFIKSTYTMRISPPDEHYLSVYTGCDMFSWTEQMCLYYGAPKQLCCAVYNCGLEYSASAFNAPQVIIDRCRLNMTMMDVGRRRRNTLPGDHMPTGDMCTDDGTDGQDVFGKRSMLPDLEEIMPPAEFVLPPFDYMADETFVNHEIAELEDYFQELIETDTVWIDDNNATLENETAVNNTDSGNGDNESSEASVEYVVYTNNGEYVPDSSIPLELIINLKLRSWCMSLSRKIRYEYHFQEREYIPHSQFWIEDVYKLAIHYRLPSPYVHSLVGCGLDYAMEAFSGTVYHAAIYRMYLW